MQDTLGHYRVVEPIGSGGMGTVYLARDERLDRNVAIKVLSSDTLIDDHARRRFRREALALSRLNHPNIATIHDFDTIDGMDVLVMEHIPGSSLNEMLQLGPLPEQEVIRLGRQLVAALEAAHERGIVHRDLKPGNVRVTPDGRLKVLDFGIAKAVQLEQEATTESVTRNAFMGTLPYMAPEQLKGEAVDRRTDIYGAGALLYEMATGARVHGELTGARLLGAILDEPPAPAREKNPRTSTALEQILSKALDRNPQLRYQSASELAVDLERLTGGDTPTREHAAPGRSRGLATAALAVVVALAGWIAYHNWRPEPPVQQPRGSLAIADFDNSTGDDGLADAIRAGLSVQLQQSRSGNVVSREQVFDALRRMQREVSSLDVETARELCVRENIPVLLAGSIQRRGDVTRVEARLIQPATGDVMFTQYVQFRNESEVFASIDELAQAVRRHLGASPPGIEERSDPLAKVTTRSLRALKQYSRAADEFARGNADAALPYLRAALDVDPEFAMAHRLIARVYETLGNAAQERAHLSRAYQLRASLTERERRHVEASYLQGNGEYEQAAETLSALAALYPGDGEAHYELAVAYRDAGNMRKAIQELETTIAQSPYVTVAYGELVLLLARVSEYARAQQVYDDAIRRGIHSPRVTWGHGMVLLGENRIPEARTEFRQLESQGDVFASIARLYQATADTYEGKLAAAAERLQRDILLDHKGHNSLAELKRREMLARVAIARNDFAEARREVTLMLKDDPDILGPEELRRAAALLARLGELRTARPVVARLATMRESIGSAFAQSCHDIAMAELALAEGQPRRAIELFRQAEAEYWRPAVTDGLARAYVAVADWPRAGEQWAKLIAARGEIMYEGFAADWVLAHAAAADAERRSGNPAAAERYQQIFLTLWRNADNIPARSRSR
jgi:eukaryotic-like serine/threonine-protein kinase